MDTLENYMGFLPDWAVGPVIALVTIVVGYIISKIAAGIVSGAINRTGLGKKAKTTGGNIGKSLSKAVFWVLWLVFILMGLSRFPQLSEPLEGINVMLTDIFQYVPRIISAGFIFFLGWVLAKIFREATTSTLEAAQVDTLVNKIGMNNEETGPRSNTIANTVGGLVFAFVLFLFGVTALGVLDIDSITGPLTSMLDQIVNYIPAIFSATVVLGLSVIIGKFVSKLAQNTLPAMGFDKTLSSLGALDGETSNVVPSKIVGTLAFIGIVLMGAIAAMNILGIEQLTYIFNELLELGGSIILGAIIIGAGLFIANIISRIVAETAGALAGRIVKYVTVILVTFMGLNQMGIGQEIVDTAFKYAIGAAAFAAGVGGALAFGLGGREWAKGKLAQWAPVKTVRKTAAPKAKPRAKK